MRFYFLGIQAGRTGLAVFLAVLCVSFIPAAQEPDASEPAESPEERKVVDPDNNMIIVAPDAFWFKSPGSEESEAQAAEEAAREAAEEKARKEAEARAKKEAEERARKQREAAEARRRAEEEARREAEAQAKREAEEEARREAEAARQQTPEAVPAPAAPAAPVAPAVPEVVAVDGPRVQQFAGISFAYCAPGSFEMGSKLSDEDLELIFGGDAKYYADERPRHRVAMTRGFWMGCHEITNAQYQTFVEATGYSTEAEREGWGRVWNGTDWEDRKGASWREPGWDCAPGLPVVLVSWNDARAYVDWLNTLGQGRFRLPTEAEWEYVCRAGDNGVYSYGDDASMLGLYARYRANALALGELYPSPVGSYRPNAWGIYDMHGNVGEWCADWYDEIYYEYASRENPEGPEIGKFRTLRGGSWYSFARFCRSAARTRALPNFRYYVLGFRVCRDE